MVIKNFTLLPVNVGKKLKSLFQFFVPVMLTLATLDDNF